MAKKQKPKSISTISAKDLATRSGESYDTIHHWAEKGLLPYKKRGRVRLFATTEAMKRCRRIRKLQEKDFNLAAIRKMLKDGD